MTPDDDAGMIAVFKRLAARPKPDLAGERAKVFYTPSPLFRMLKEPKRWDRSSSFLETFPVQE